MKPWPAIEAPMHIITYTRSNSWRVKALRGWTAFNPTFSSVRTTSPNTAVKARDCTVRWVANHIASEATIH